MWGIDWKKKMRMRRMMMMRRRSAFFHLNTTNFCVSSALFGWWFCKFSFWSLCTPPSRKTYYDTIYCDIIQLRPVRAKFQSDIWTHVPRGCGDKHVATIFIGARLHRIGALRRGYTFSTRTMWVNALCQRGSGATNSEKCFSINSLTNHIKPKTQPLIPIGSHL